VRAQSHSWQATRDDWRRSQLLFRCDGLGRNGDVRKSCVLFDPPPTARLLGTALANDQMQPLDTVRFKNMTPLMRISGVFYCALKGGESVGEIRMTKSEIRKNDE